MDAPRTDILEVVVADLADAPAGSIGKVAKAAGLSYFTLIKIVRGKSKNPRHQTVERLRVYYQSLDDREIPQQAA